MAKVVIVCYVYFPIIRKTNNGHQGIGVEKERWIGEEQDIF